MAKLLRWAGYAFGFIIILVLITAIAIWAISARKLSAEVPAHAEHLQQPTPAQLADIERRARTLGCFSCHGDGLRGDKMFDEPMIGTVWAPNLTEVAAHATDQQLAQAIRQGVSDEGRPLFVMPSEVYQHLSDQEVAALIAMIRSQPRGGSRTPDIKIGPLGRLGIVMGKFRTAPELVIEYATKEPIRVGDQNEAGRRLAVLNCSGCHGPSLEGKEAAPGEISPDLSIVGAYDLPAFKKLLRTGVPASGKTLNMMGPTAKVDLSHMTDAEIEQLHDYLQARAQKVSR
jgi:cytochrome c553